MISPLSYSFSDSIACNTSRTPPPPLVHLVSSRELKQWCLLSDARPGGDTPLYKPCQYVPPQRVGFLRRFGLKTGIDFAYFGLELRMVFEGTTGVSV